MAKPQPKVINPRYAGATPKDVARALLKHGVKKEVNIRSGKDGKIK